MAREYHDHDQRDTAHEHFIHERIGSMPDLLRREILRLLGSQSLESSSDLCFLAIRLLGKSLALQEVI